MHKILRLAESSPQVEQLGKMLEKKGSTVLLNEMVGGAFLFYMAATIARRGGAHNDTLGLLDTIDHRAFIG